ncbi:MAG TPA: hypothetical protein VGL19_08655 [Polyangiaceae bacterium]|jgi:hypothetical protein
MKTRIAIQPNRLHAGHYRTAVCRFHNSLYLGCVIGVLLGFGLADSALSWPRRAWRQARPGPARSPAARASFARHGRMMAQ